MTIWVDTPIWPAHGRLWCHVISDVSLEELHAFARRAGIPERSFEGDHYDVPAERRDRVIAAGAVPTTGGDLIRRLADSGMRFRKRRRERPLGRHRDGLAWLGLPHTLEVVASPHEPAAGAAAAVVLVGARDSREMVLVRSASRDGWAPPGGKREPRETVREAAVRELEEETGLALHPAGLAPVGYERITVAQGHARGTWVEGVNLLAVLAARVPSRTDVAPQLDDVVEARWASRALAERLCGEEPWWPLVDWWWQHH
jgi:8-oxo-dGTP pyrophosphatase MutT (NUDIX family)